MITVPGAGVAGQCPSHVPVGPWDGASALLRCRCRYRTEDDDDDDDKKTRGGGGKLKSNTSKSLI